jgi:hypothetical protein
VYFRVYLRIRESTNFKDNPLGIAGAEKRLQTEDNMGSAGFEPANSSAQGWHHTKLDNDPFVPTIHFLQVNFKFRKVFNHYNISSII